MMSTRYKNRHRVKEHLDAEMEARRLIRAYLRKYHPDIPEPPGGGWVFQIINWPCISCAADLFRVRVPTVNIPTLAYCPTCMRVAEGDIGN